ncbi:OLC1v1034462C4 [Oldenlandia corymbosa var. corymbosa]|uniref:Carbonic anhydrase n=1 Tax=Oldenlandia corymbosa var. corymbosa TaxID=529605 RepID=A0AAV1CTI2_OLDCO|nr:OLC1v1034462C4 [Oldenlandia corymbosa var. corymbosa]
MKSQNKARALVLVVILAFWATSATNAQEVENEREFDYAENSRKGPRVWGQLKKEWAACGNGELQSPIDMSHERVQIISKPEKKMYKPANATVKNRGHDISIQWSGDAGSIVINGSYYPLRQAHWHSPSEHTINGRRYDLELHMVHQNDDPNLKYNIAVVGVLYRSGAPDPFLTKLMSNISSMIHQKDEERNVSMVDPSEIPQNSKRFYRYMGSLTVPPCTEGVIWTINRKVKFLTFQLSTFNFQPSINFKMRGI